MKQQGRNDDRYRKLGIFPLIQPWDKKQDNAQHHHLPHRIVSKEVSPPCIKKKQGKREGNLPETDKPQASGKERDEYLRNKGQIVWRDVLFEPNNESDKTYLKIMTDFIDENQ